MKKVIAIILTVIMSVFALGCWEQGEPKFIRERLRKGGVILPETAKYVYEDEWGFQDGFGYYVYTFEEYSQDWLSENSFEKGKDEKFEEEYNTYFDLFGEDSVPPEKYCVDFEKDYYYCTVFGEGYVFYIVFIPERLTLIAFYKY